MQGHSEKNSAAMLSLAAATLLTLVKLGVGLYTNSLGILSEALHSGLDLVAALMTLFAVRMAAQPADRNHPYGHGKAENLSALGETLLLLLTSVWIMEAYDRLVSGGAPVLPSLWGVGVMALSITIDINRARMLHKVAKKFKSQALEADALHFWSDIWSSGVVLAGVLAVWCGSWLPETSPVRPFLNSADAVAALLVSLIILKSCFSMARRAINALMDEVTGRPEENAIQMVALKAMMKAKYSTHNIGHFGLAFDYYTHFTSPIRRYPDTMVHRLLTRYAEGARSANQDHYEELCEHSSDMEQVAATAERDSIKYKMVEYMSEFIGQEFDAHISGITSYGIYAEIDENHCEGMILIRDLKDDYYEFDERNFCLIGRRRHNKYQLGDAIRIKVARANLDKKQLDFVPAE